MSKNDSKRLFWQLRMGVLTLGSRMDKRKYYRLLKIYLHKKI